MAEKGSRCHLIIGQDDWDSWNDAGKGEYGTPFFFLNSFLGEVTDSLGGSSTTTRLILYQQLLPLLTSQERQLLGCWTHLFQTSFAFLLQDSSAFLALCTCQLGRWWFTDFEVVRSAVGAWWRQILDQCGSWRSCLFLWGMMFCSLYPVSLGFFGVARERSPRVASPVVLYSPLQPDKKHLASKHHGHPARYTTSADHDAAVHDFTGFGHLGAFLCNDSCCRHLGGEGYVSWIFAAYLLLIFDRFCQYLLK